MLQLQNVTAFYGSTPIIHNITLDVPEGTCTCVLGRNGVGKSTLLKCIMGLTSRSTGSLRLADDEVSQRPTHTRAKLGLGYVPQGRRILGKLTVRENLVLGTFAQNPASRQGRARGSIPEGILDLFPYLSSNLDKRAGLLSGGQQQQLAIARALATEPKVLLLDEPTEGIQPNIVAEINSTLQRLVRELNLTLVLTEQHVQSAKALSNYFVIMDTGRVVENGDIRNLNNQLLDRYLSV